MRPNISVWFFVIALITFMTYLWGVNIGVNPPLPLFWSSGIVMVIVILRQIITLQEETQSDRVILFEIFLMTLAFHLIFVIPISTGLLGNDPYIGYYAAKATMNYGWPIPENVPILAPTRQISEWPMLHIFAGIVSTITGADLFILAKWLPSVYSSFAIIFVYLLAKTIYENKRIALLASFGVSGIIWYIFFHSKFVREGFAFVLFFGVLYTFAKAIKERKIILGCLTILLMFSLIFTHHLTSLLLVLLLLTWHVFYRFDLLRLLRAGSVKTLKTSLPAPGIFLTFTALVTISAVSFWIFIGQWVIKKLVSIVNELNVGEFERATVRYVGLGSLRATIAFYGNLALVLMFSALVLMEIIRKKNYESRKEDLVFLAWNSIMLSFIMSPWAEYSRFLIYGYPFLLIATANAILKRKNRPILYGLFFIFVLLSLYSIPPHIYNRSVSPEYEAGGYRDYYLPQEYSSVYWSNFTGIAIGDYRTYALFAGLRQLKVAYDERATQIFNGDLEALRACANWLIFNYEDLKSVLSGSRVWLERAGQPMTNETYDNLQQAVYLSKVYANGQVEIYRVNKP